MRNVPPISRSWTMFMCRPSSRQRAVTAAPSSGEPSFVVAVEHELEPLHEAAAADVADDRVAVRQLAQPGVQRLALPRAARRCPRLEDVHDGQADGATSGSQTWVVKNRYPRSKARSSISALVTTAASGRPAPSVLDSVRMSGTTPSCSKA